MSWAIAQSGRTVATRRVPPSYKPWAPLPYQLKAVDHLVNNHAAGLPLRPGGRKTSITLAAFKKLRALGQVQTMLVIAPLRVCRQQWRQEAAKWEEFRDLKFSLLHGPNKEDRLNDDADIWLINPEGVEWLAKQYFGRSLPFDIVCIDELTKFKNSSSGRSKALRPRLARVLFRWGLTGSLAPNGYMDVFGQMLMLDDGAALGRYITHYRDNYFQLGWDGFTYDLMPGAEKRIVDKISPYWFKMRDEDYSQLPPLVPVPHELELEPAERKLYNKMKNDMIAQLPEGVVTAANSAACYSKLSQMANGAVYATHIGAINQPAADKHKVSHIHDLKLDAIEDLLEELNGEPLLVAYEFNHDLERLRDRFGVLDKATGRKVIPYLGKGTTAAQEADWVAAWNRGELPLLCAHPASAGHGLNLQGASACNVAWFGITWDFELYDQFIRRIMRDGTQARQIFNHLLIVKNTIDELKLVALSDKDMTQSNLLRALNTEIRRSADTLAAQGDAAPKRIEPVVMKLSRNGGTPAAQDTASQADSNVVKPKGWGGRAAAAVEPAEPEPKVDDSQRDRIQATLKGEVLPPENRSEGAKSAFTGRVAETQARIQEEYQGGDQHSNGVRTDPPFEGGRDTSNDVRDPAPEPRTRRSRTSPPSVSPSEVSPAPVIHVAGPAIPDTSPAILVAARVKLVTALVPLFDNVDDVKEAANDLWNWAQAV